MIGEIIYFYKLSRAHMLVERCHTKTRTSFRTVVRPDPWYPGANKWVGGRLSFGPLISREAF